MSGHALTRRTVLTGSLGAAAAAVLPGSALQSAAASDATQKLRPVTMAMHIHGPFSEGPASFEAHLDQARRTNVDVIWWTDHDFRVAAHDFRKAVHFEGPAELEGELSWTWARADTGTLVAPVGEFTDSPRATDDPGKALRLAATGGDATGGSITYTGTAWNATYSAAIGDTTLELSVRPEVCGPGAVLFVQLDLSYHPARAGRPAGMYALRYEIGGVSARRATANGLLGTVELPAAAGEWTTLQLALPDDVASLWPDLVAGDNAIRRLRIGVTVAARASADFAADRLVFHRTRREGQAGEDMRAEVLAKYAAEYPDVTHYRAYEVSLVRHLNWFGGDQTLPEFPSPPYRDNSPDLTAKMVDFLHSHGGIVCWNHPLDVETPATLAKLMLERGNLGADLVEIGRAPQDDLLRVLDIAARNAIFFTAVGASDDHDGKSWLTIDQRNFTCVWARTTAKDELVAALRAGKAWFVDPAVYRGAMDIRLRGSSVMGGVAVTQAREVPLNVIATHLPDGAKLEVITGNVDHAGAADLTPKTTVTTVTDLESGGRHPALIQPGDGCYVRAQVRAADNTIVGVSNPVWLLRTPPVGGIPDGRRHRLAL